ncbi:MAG: hypothetical protein GVY16_05180 [Planctomycetes bacterium]|jgi:DnaJ-domain-containing protein 1|nr:TerB family tellurite resistance protein [Phycisphaerae bacterium]NBB95115.1 hypothetical protein [Planctomycetota bacterium]
MDDNAQRQLRNAIVMAWLDGDINDAERHFIHDLRRRLGIEKEDFDAVVAEVKADPKRLSVSRGADGLVTLEQLIEVAAADGEVAPAERTLLARVGAYLGLGEAELENMLPAETPDPAQAEAIERQVQALYEQWADWDAATRESRIAEIAEAGQHAVIPLLQVMESYRTPRGVGTAVDLKIAIARQLGALGDKRAVYYLAHQVGIGDADDDITSGDLRQACAEAVARLAGQDFGEQPVAAARDWWRAKGRRTYNTLAM